MKWSDGHHLYTTRQTADAPAKSERREVVDTLESPDEVIPGDNGEEIAVKRFGVRQVRVVYQEMDEGSVVIYTVMNSRQYK